MRGRRSRRELDASAQSAHVAERTSANHRAVPTPGPRRLSEGVVVEASIIARLLRWRLLTLDASVVLLPASPSPAEPAAPRQVTLPANGSSHRRRLSEAITNIEQAEHELTRARLASVPGNHD